MDKIKPEIRPQFRQEVASNKTIKKKLNLYSFKTHDKNNFEKDEYYKFTKKLNDSQHLTWK